MQERNSAKASDGLVLTFGELMLRLSPPDHLRIEQATSFGACYGGAEANVALSVALQGDAAAYVSIVPANRIGDCALRSLSAYGVDVSRVIREGDRLGTYFFEVGASQRMNAALYDRKYSAVSLASHEDFDWGSILDGVEVFYFSGVTPAISPEMAAACREALEECRRRAVTTVCDLNYRGKMWSPDAAQRVMRELMPLVDICIANDEDSRQALGIVHGTGSLAYGIEELCEYVEIARDICRDYGCSLVASIVRDIACVERSKWMGLLYSDEGHESWTSPIYDMNVLEGVAAGDAFSAGLVYGLRHSMGMQELIDYAIAASVLKLTIRGDSNFVSHEEIEALAKSADAGSRVSR